MERRDSLDLGEVHAEVIRKPIKHVHLSVYPPHGRVRISAPEAMTLETIRLYAITKLGWIKRQQSKILAQERETPREYLDRESHYVWGKRYLLKVVPAGSAPTIELKHSVLELHARPDSPESKHAELLEAWYPGPDQGSRSCTAAEVGTPDGRASRPPACAAHENEMGWLQPSNRVDPPQHRLGEEAASVPRIHLGPRADPPD